MDTFSQTLRKLIVDDNLDAIDARKAHDDVGMTATEISEAIRSVLSGGEHDAFLESVQAATHWADGEFVVMHAPWENGSRDRMLDALRSSGLRVAARPGQFYVYGPRHPAGYSH